jgi:hypothetical protein
MNDWMKFHVEHEDDAWELGVCHRAGALVGSALSLGVPVSLIPFFEAGRHDHDALSQDRIDQFVCQWGNPIHDVDFDG